MPRGKSASKVPIDVLSKLPELPAKFFELGASLGFSDTAPVIINRPKVVSIDRPSKVTARVNRSSHEIHQWFGWATYPKIVCHPLPDPEVMARMKLDVRNPISSKGELDLVATATERSKVPRPAAPIRSPSNQPRSRTVSLRNPCPRLCPRALSVAPPANSQ